MLIELYGRNTSILQMRILVVTQYFWPENFRINDLVSELIKRGHEITILTGIPSYPNMEVYYKFINNPSEYNSYQGANIIRVPMITRGNAGLKLVINYLSFAISASIIGIYRLRGLSFDSIFVFEPSPITVGIPAIILRKLKKAPLIFWVLDLWPDTLKAVGTVKSDFFLKAIGILVSFIYKRCDLILGQSQSFIVHIKNLSGHGRVKYFPSWAESIFQINSDHIESAQANLEKFNITFAGNIGKSQDFPAIIEAIDLLKNNSHIHWTFVGDGRYSEWLKKEIQNRGLETSVSIEGRHPIEKMPVFFSQSDALLVSLKDEPIFAMTIPGKLQAYLKTGKPILGMLNGEGARIITQSGCGISCNAGDSKGLAEAVINLSQMTNEQRLNIGAKGKEFSLLEFDRDILISRLENWMIELSSDVLAKK